MSGDSDYIELVRHLKSEGVRVEIAAIPDTTSALLIEESDYFHAVTKDDWFEVQLKEKRLKQNVTVLKNNGITFVGNFIQLRFIKNRPA